MTTPTIALYEPVRSNKPFAPALQRLDPVRDGRSRYGCPRRTRDRGPDSKPDNRPSQPENDSGSQNPLDKMTPTRLNGRQPAEHRHLTAKACQEQRRNQSDLSDRSNNSEHDQIRDHVIVQRGTRSGGHGAQRGPRWGLLHDSVTVG